MQRAKGARPARGAVEGGFTLVDVTVAMLILMVALGGLAATVVSSRNLARANDDAAVAHERARQMAETLSATAFDQIFVTFANQGFAVPGLNVRPGDPDGLAGSILFPGDGIELREDADVPALGMPRDLNMDEDVDDQDHAGDYVLLPVTVRVEWTGASGQGLYELHLLLVD